jgi:ABC-type polysaccharide/polyol phosphate transport system ATPase subunit
LIIGDIERVGIYAQSGTGKSTLAKLLAGIERPKSGKVIHNGRVSWPIGQAGIVHPNLTLVQNIQFIADVTGLDHEKSLLMCLSLSQLSSARDQKVKSLSPSQRAVFSFGLGLIVPAQHYLFDDKISAGDEQMQERCSQYLEARLVNSGLVIVTRNKRILEANCSRFYHFSRDTLIEVESISKLERVIVNA